MDNKLAEVMQLEEVANLETANEPRRQTQVDKARLEIAATDAIIRLVMQELATETMNLDVAGVLRQHAEIMTERNNELKLGLQVARLVESTSGDKLAAAEKLRGFLDGSEKY